MTDVSIAPRLPKKVWTAEAVAELKHYVAGGLTGGQIASLMGVTRNSIIGKMSRLDLPSNSKKKCGHRVRHAEAAPVPPAEPLPPPKPPMPLAKRTTPFRPAPPQPPPPPASEPYVEPTTGEIVRCSLLDLTPTTCRWPIGDVRLPGFGFCGAWVRAESKPPYCAAHTARALA